MLGSMLKKVHSLLFFSINFVLYVRFIGKTHYMFLTTNTTTSSTTSGSLYDDQGERIYGLNSGDNEYLINLPWISKNYSPNTETHKDQEMTVENYNNSLFSTWNSTYTQIFSGKNPFIPTKTENLPKIYKRGSWDEAPIVIQEYQLIFFTQGKVACTVFKQLLRRMMHLPDWNLHKEPHIPHNPGVNGLKYLYHFSPQQALEMMTSPHWTRAIFVRDPKERVLSAYLDKAARKEGKYVHKHCCYSDPNKECAKNASKSFLDFIKVISNHCCCDPHWKSQTNRIPAKFWSYINFVGNFENLADDTRQLLDRMHLWEKFGSNGWGMYGNESIFAQGTSAKHQTSAGSKTCNFYKDPHIHDLVETFYSEDYAHPMLNFSRDALFKNCS